jgi:acetate kinase
LAHEINWRQIRMSYLLTINGGSSSIKIALFQSDTELVSVLSGQFARIGLENSSLEVTNHATHTKDKQTISAPGHAACIPLLINVLSHHISWNDLDAIGHRIVHGGVQFIKPEPVTPALLTELERLAPYAPEHLPSELALLKAFAARDSELEQIACFDTAFHQTMPHVAKLLPLPRRYFAQGIQRYGFHGLSYEFLMSELERSGGKETARGRVILAHLGNGASMAAVRDGKSIDTSMSFTPTGGLVMSTRTGDLDPGVVVYFARTIGMTAEAFQRMVNAESGLRGVSEVSSDMRDLLAREGDDERAADAVELFCRQAKKFIGAYAAVLGGLDTLVFSGGIGENSAIIRARICKGLEFLGIELDSVRNDANSAVISSDVGRMSVRVIKTDEELQIARHIQNRLKGTI